MKAKLLRYGITVAVGGVIAVLVFWATGMFVVETKSEIYRSLSDGFFVTGVLIAGWGLLVVASNGGTFDIFGYGAKCFFSLFQFKNKGERQAFHEYRNAKREKKRSFFYLIIVGCVYIALAALFALLYAQL